MIVQVYAPTTSHTEEDINSIYNNVDETSGKPNHYTIVMGNFNAQIGKEQMLPKRNGQIWTQIEKRKRRHFGRMSTQKYASK